MMQESDTYLMILEEGEEKATRELILGLGEPRLDSPDESVIATLKSITDLPRLKRIALQAPVAASWHELMETP
ncbi:MAG TPA: hypothetical protein PK867_25130 [Pirellulales bacterium]|nr:hypothetical protein [Pirellulales bacterium]